MSLCGNAAHVIPNSYIKDKSRNSLVLRFIFFLRKKYAEAVLYYVDC